MKRLSAILLALFMLVGCSTKYITDVEPEDLYHYFIIGYAYDKTSGIPFSLNGKQYIVIEGIGVDPVKMQTQGRQRLIANLKALNIDPAKTKVIMEDIKNFNHISQYKMIIQLTK